MPEGHRLQTPPTPYEPALHCEQGVTASTKQKPGAHGAQAEAPGAFAYDRSGQGGQALRPAVPA